jgi:hypothetical protein
MSAQDGASNRSYGTCEQEEQMDDREDDRLLPGDHQDNPNSIVIASGEDNNAPGQDVQEGVVNIEAMSQTWTQRSLIIAYLGFVNPPPLPFRDFY